MNRRFVTKGLQVSGRLVYTIWYDNDYSGFHLTKGGLILAFSNLADLNKYAAEINIEFEKMYGCMTYDFDVIAECLTAPKGKTVMCNEFLDLYNLAGDYRNSLAERNLDIEDKSYPKLLVKLFWGCNLAPVTPPGKKFTPVWSKAEVRELRRAMRESLLVFETKLYVVSDELPALS